MFVEIVPKGKLVKLLSTAGKSCAYAVGAEKIRLNCSALRAVECVSHCLDQIVPFPSSVDVRADRQQYALRRFSVRLVVVNGNAGGFDPVGNHFVPLIDQ